MNVTTPPAVVGIFENQEQTGRAIEALKQVGFTDAQISFASRERTHELDAVRVDEQHTAEHGAINGAIVGGSLGVAVGLVGAMLVPGAAPIVGGTALLSALGGGLAGAGIGVYAGPFIALGFSEHEARVHGEHVKQGKTVLLVQAPGREDEARAIMVDQGAYDDSMNPSPPDIV